MSAANNIRNELGPYKATKLWNDIVRIFRTGMPIGRHWRQLRAYDDSFVASEAVEWLFEYLQHHHNSGSELTRPQVVKLLQKFHRNNYIEDVKGEKYNLEVFEENNRLFRFVALSPLKTPQWPRFKSVTTQQSDATKRLSDLRTNNIFQELEPSSDAAPSDTAFSVSHDSRSQSSTYSQTSKSERAGCAVANTDLLWKSVVLERLMSILPHTDPSLHQGLGVLKHSHVKHNMTVLHKNGYVTGINRSELPPSWVISAMRYLAKWPDKGEDSFPEYVGFEKDVLVMVKDYFESQRQPLTTYTLYPVLVKVYHLVSKIGPSPIEREANRVLHVSETTPQRYLSSHQSRHQQQRNTSSSHRSSIPSYRNPPSIPAMLTTRQPAVPRDDVIVVYDGHSNPAPSPDYHLLSEVRGSRAQSDIPQQGSGGRSNLSDQPSKRRHRWQLHRPNMTRSASFSHLLGGSRVETAFVGDDAYTVYYSSRHKLNSRSSSSPPDQPSCLTRAQSAYAIDQRSQPTNHLPSFNKPISSRAMSNHYLGPGCERQCSGGHSSHDQYDTQPFYGSYNLSKHQSLRDVTRAQGSTHSEAHDMTDRYRDTGSIRLRFHSTPSINVDDSLPYDLFAEEYHDRLVECLQLVLLFLPPPNRRVLHMLLKLLNKTSSNRELVLDSGLSNKRLVTSLFWRCILNCENEVELNVEASVKIVKFLVENMEQVISVPQNVKCEVERRIMKTKLPQEPKVACNPVALRNRTNLPTQQERLPSKPAGIPPKAVGRLGITTPGRVFCEQITTEQYKSQANQVFEMSMKELLKNIVEDHKMSAKEKTKRLKQFQRTYPEIFAAKFPTADSVKVALDNFERNRPKVKQPLLSRPMNLLKKLR